MNYRTAFPLIALPFALYAEGCSGASSGSVTCPVDPQCYVVSASGECSVDPAATCMVGSWQCSSDGRLGSGCLPDGGIVPPPQDAGTCLLAGIQPPMACVADTTCLAYGGHCEFDGLTGAGDCVCGPPAQDGGGPDVCTLDCYGDYCGLPSFTITCNGPNDTTTCAQYNAACVGTPVGQWTQYACECLAQHPPMGATGN